MEGVNRFGMAGSSDLREPSLESAGAAAFTQRLEHGNPRFHLAIFCVQPLDVVEHEGRATAAGGPPSRRRR